MKTFVDAQIKHAPSNVKPRRAGRAINPLVTCAVIAFVGFLASIACAVPSFAQIVGTVQLNIERRGHTATLLEDGKVLIVGGDNQSGIVNQVELLDPASQTSSLAAMPIVARTDHTATRLADGRVLIIGGRDQNGSLTSTEIYNPLTATFTAGRSLTTPRSGHTATVLATGAILVAGGDASGSAELYNPTTQSFSLIAGSMNTARKFQSAILLNNGQVLIAGGVGAQNNVLNTAEVYDPSSQSFYVPPTDMQTPRALAMLKLLSDGKVQLIGGDAELSLEVFDPVMGIFNAKALLPPNANLLGATLSTQSRAALFSPLVLQDPMLQGVLTPEQSALLDRADQSITELPSRNQALVAGGINSAGQILNSAKLVSSSTASVTTDKTDYAPGQIVTITGNGFQPNEQIDIYFHEFPEEYPDIFLSAVANQQGNFVTAEFAPQEIDLGRIFTLTAIGQTSGFVAQTAFKDNKNFTIRFAGNGGGSVAFSSVTGSPGPSTNPCTGTPNPCVNALNNNATGTITATANVGSVFAGWSAIVLNGNGSITCAANSCTFNMGTGGGDPKEITVTFNAAAATTTTSINAPSITYNANGSVMVTVSSTAGMPTGNVSLAVDGGPAVSKALSSGSATFTNADIGALTSPSAGDHALNASYAAQGNFAASSATGNLHVDQAPSVTVVTCPASVIYTGAAQTPCTATVTGAGGLSLTPTPTYANNTNVGTASASYTYAGDANHTGSSDSKNFAIDPAPSITTVNCPANVTYTGAAQTPCTATVTGAGGLSLTPTPTYANNTNVGTASASYTYAGDANHTGSSDSKNFAIDPAPSITTVNCPANVIYTGAAQTPCTATVTGAGGLSLTPTPTYANNTNVGTASASYTYAGDTNHTGSSDSKNFAIDPAPSITTVNCPASVIYTGAAQTPCTATVTGAGGLSLTPTPTYANNTNVGTASASYTYAGDANHTGSSDSKNFAIDPAPSITTVNCPANVIYTGAAQTPCTATVTGAGGLSLTPTPTYANNTNVGTASASYTYAGDANHTGSSDSKNFAIDPAPSITTVNCPASVIYTGSAQTPCTATVTGAGGLSLTPTPTYANNTTVGTASASYTYAGDANHTGSSDSKNFAIDPAPSITTVNCPASVIYTGAAQTPCTATVTGAGGLSLTPTPTYANNTNVGTASASYTYAGDANHTGSSDSKNFAIDPAPSITTVNCPANVIYTGAAQTPCTATVTGAGGLSLTPTPTYANNTNVGTASASYTYAGDANHTGSSDSKNFAIDPAPSITTVNCPASVIYTGSAQTPCTATVTGAGGLSLTPTPTYANNTNVGTASASYTYAGDANHTGSSDSKNFAIDPAPSITTVNCPASVIYTGAAQTPCTATVTGAGGLSLTPTPTYANNTNVGTASASYTYAGDANHTGSSDSKNFAIDPAPSITTVNCPASVIYTGAAQTPCTATVTGAGGLSLTPTPTYANNTNVGTASASYTYAGDANHTGSSDSKNFAIDPAPSITTVNCPASVIYTGSAQTPCTATVTGAGGLSLTPTPTYANNTNVGTASASYTYAGDTNHTGSSDSKNFAIDPAPSITTVNCPANVIYTGAAQTPCTATVTGAGGLSLTPTPTYANNTNVGTASASYTYAGDTNHTGSSDSKNITITTGFAFNGFYSPIGGSVENGNGGSYGNPLKTFKLGSTIPVKFGATWLTGGAPLITGIHTLQAVKYSNATDWDPPIDATPTDAATDGNSFRLTSTDWHFNLSTKDSRFSAGTWLLIATLQDGSKHSVWITIKK